jgi:hypothetical protein
LAIFVPFWMLNKIVYFKAHFGEILAKIALFYEILTLNLLKNLDIIRLFSSLRIWPFLNCLWPNLDLNFFEPGNPDVKQLLSLTIE